MTTHTEKRFKDTLARLETALERPLIPGELESWAQEVQTEAEAFDGLLQGQVEGHHAEVFGNIKQEDEALIQRVERMREEDRNIRTEFDAFLSEARKLRDKAPGSEPDEATETDRVAHVSDKGLILVIRIRKHELHIQTWLVESAWRDRGVKD